MNENEPAFAPVAADVAGSERIERAGDNAERTLVFHYHLFKNAGTSVDELLRRNFGSRWASREFHVIRRDNAANVAEFIGNNPDLLSISSHTALLPVPEISGVKIFPIIFIRHPIDRLRSVYEFERRQNASTAGARLAKMHDFAEYLRELLRNPRHRQLRNFQTFRLSHNESPRNGSELERATRVITNFPFIGLVERFEASVRELQEGLQPNFADFRADPVHKNPARFRQGTLAERLLRIESTIGRELYEDICAANCDDLTIHDLVNARFSDFRDCV